MPEGHVRGANHLTEQWASEFLRLYPAANILVTTKKDFERRNRQKFCAHIATGDYDAVIIGHSQFERIPVSQERQERFIQEQIDEVVAGIQELKRNHGEQFTVKQLVKTQKQLEHRLEKLQATERKDDVVTFEQLGVDRLYVDEAHAYKNLFLTTKMRNVAGLSTSEAQKSSDMFLKCRYMDELTGSRGIVFATGTPVSNSMTELYTMQRYLQYGTLQRSGMVHFDAWASTFGETVTAIELAPEGTGYRARTRFAKFFNLPELMTMFREVADIKTADQLHLPTPTAHYETMVVQPTAQQEQLVQSLSERAAQVHSGSVDASIDNMLKITSDGRKLGLDQRLINPMLPDDPGSKVNACVNNVFRIWNESSDKRLTQLIFCDLSTPKTTAGAENPAFSVYDDIRAKLISMGVPAEEIAFIHDANTEARKNADMQTLAEHPVPEKSFAGMEANGRLLTDKEAAGQALLNACKDAAQAGHAVQLGSYRGLTMSVDYDSFSNLFYLTLRGQMSHRVELSSSPLGNLVRIENALSAIPDRLAAAQAEMENQRQQMEAAKAEMQKPFPQEEELKAKSARLAELDAQLDMDGASAVPAQEKPSIRETLKEPAKHVLTKRTKHFEEER